MTGIGTERPFDLDQKTGPRPLASPTGNPCERSNDPPPSSRTSRSARSGPRSSLAAIRPAVIGLVNRGPLQSPKPVRLRSVGVLPSGSPVVHRSGRCRRRQSGTDVFPSCRDSALLRGGRPFGWSSRYRRLRSSAFGRIVSRNGHRPRNPDRGDRRRRRLLDGGTTPRDPGTGRILEHLI